jgi:hypothetical protein
MTLIAVTGEVAFSNVDAAKGHRVRNGEAGIDEAWRPCVLSHQEHAGQQDDADPDSNEISLEHGGTSLLKIAAMRSSPVDK